MDPLTEHVALVVGDAIDVAPSRAARDSTSCAPRLLPGCARRRFMRRPERRAPPDVRRAAEQQARKATTLATGGSVRRVGAETAPTAEAETAPTAEGGPHRLIELVTLQLAKPDGVNRTLERLLSSSATVLVLDAVRQASERLPSLVREASQATHTSRSAWADASSWADARSGVGLYATRCLARLGRRQRSTE